MLYKKFFKILLVLTLLLIVCGYWGKRAGSAYIADSAKTYARQIGITYTGDVQKNTCRWGVCVIVPDVHWTILGRDVPMGDVEIGLLFRYPWTIRVGNDMISHEHNFIGGSADLSENKIVLRDVKFALWPLAGRLNGTSEHGHTDIRGKVVGLKDAFLTFIPQINPNIPPQLAMMFTNEMQDIVITQESGWLKINNVPLWMIR